MASTDHPTPDELHALLVGDLHEERIQAVGSHLDSCSSCRTKLDVFGGTNDTVVMGLRASKGVGAADADADEATASVLRRIAAIGLEASEAGRPEALEERTPRHPERLGAYVLLEKLGEGGMGAVYKARHVRLDKIVALKALSFARVADRSALARFEREMKAVGKVDHPNVVRAMDAGEVDGAHFLVMEYVPGTDLADLVRRRGPLPIADACELIRQAALGLQEAHEHGMVHRDVKPGNLMLSDRGVVKVLDLGLALLADGVEDHDLTGTGQVMGTVDYMAPEQGGDSHDVDIRVDVYALGATLYRLLTGKNLFDGPQRQSILAKLTAIATQEPPPVRERRPDVPPGLAAVLAKMIAKRKEERFATPGEVATALAPYCRGAELIALVAVTASGKVSAAETPTTSAHSAELDTTAGSILDLPKTGSPPRKNSRWPLVAVVCGFVPLAILGIVFFLQTPKGTIRVEIEDPAIEVRVKGEDLTVAGVGSEESRISAGDHVLVVTRGDLTFETKAFQVRRNGVVVIDAALVDGVTVLKADDREIGRGGTPSVADSSPDDSEVGHRSHRSEVPPAPQALSDHALRFDGRRSYVDTSCVVDADAPFTIEAIVTQVRARPTITAIASSLAHPRPPGFSLYQDGGRVVFSRNWNSVEPRVETASFLDEETAFAIAGVWDGRRLSVFLDGKLASRDSDTWPFPTSSLPKSFILGAERIDPVDDAVMGFHFHGTIDEIRISNRVRYREDYAPKSRLDADENTLALYHCDEGSGSELRDSSANGNHGRLVDATWVASPAWTKKPLKIPDASPRVALTESQPAVWPDDAPSPAVAPFDETSAKAHQEAWADYLRVPAEFENAIGMKFRLVPPGTFDRGSTVEEIERVLAEDGRPEAWRTCVRSEGPQHRVTLTKPFYLGIHEVTQAQYERVEKKNPSLFAPTGPGKGLVVGVDAATLPVDSLSWKDAAEFCSALSEAEGLLPSQARGDAAGVPLAGTGYRLPTDAEWEFACRAGTTGSYWVGEAEALVSAAWFNQNSGGRTHPVGELRANPFGFHDILGNVWELTSDAGSPDYYTQFARAEAVDPLGPLTADINRCFRGSSWSNPQSDCRSAHRYWGPMSHRHSTFGFRVAIGVEAAKNAIARSGKAGS